MCLIIFFTFSCCPENYSCLELSDMITAALKDRDLDKLQFVSNYIDNNLLLKTDGFK